MNEKYLITGHEPAAPVAIGSVQGLTIIQELASRQMAAYRSNATYGGLPAADLAVFAVVDAKALIRALNLHEIKRGSEGILEAVRQLQEGAES